MLSNSYNPYFIYILYNLFIFYFGSQKRILDYPLRRKMIFQNVESFNYANIYKSGWMSSANIFVCSATVQQ